MKETIYIHWGGKLHTYEVRARSDNKNPKGKYEEDLHFGAVEAFNDFYRDKEGRLNQEPGMSSAMAALPSLAKFYEIADRNEIVDGWVKHWSGIYLSNPIY